MQIAEKTTAFRQRTANYVLLYEADGSALRAYCGASFAPEGEHSHSGWIVYVYIYIFLHGCAISWKSGRQSTITLSTAEAELTALSDAVLALQSSASMIEDVIEGGQSMQLPKGPSTIIVGT